MSTSTLDKLCEFHEMPKHTDLFVAIGKKTIILGEPDINVLQGRRPEKHTRSTGWRRYVPFLKSNGNKEITIDRNNENLEADETGLIVIGKDFNKKKPIFINESNISRYLFPHCCHPIPGDDTLGYIDNRDHIEIHKRSCPVAAKLKASFGTRIIDARWDMHKQLFFDAIVEIKGIDRHRMLHDIADVISDQFGVNFHRVTLSSDNGIFDGTIELRVHDREDLSVIIESLKKITNMQSVQEIL